RSAGPGRGDLSARAGTQPRDSAPRREIEAERAQHRTTVRWIIAFIAGFTVFAIVNRSYSAPYGSLVGQTVLALVALMYAASLGWLHRLGTIPAPGRFLDQRIDLAAGPQAASHPAAAGRCKFWSRCHLPSSAFVSSPR